MTTAFTKPWGQHVLLSETIQLRNSSKPTGQLPEPSRTCVRVVAGLWLMVRWFKVGLVLQRFWNPSLFPILKTLTLWNLMFPGVCWKRETYRSTRIKVVDQVHLNLKLGLKGWKKNIELITLPISEQEQKKRHFCKKD